MNYEKLYNAALERARQFSEHPLQEDSADIVEYIFPELADDDERIRKELIEQIYYIPPQQNELTEDLDTLPCYEERIERYRAWLEKQGEQKTAYPHWISVEDKLPPIRQGVIAYNGVTNHKAWVLEDGSWIADTHKEWERNCFKQYPVTLWMPLPQPPKKGGEK